MANICGNILSSGTSYVENKEWQIKFSFGVRYYQILMKYEDEVDLSFRMLQVIYIRRKLTAWVLYFGVVVASYSFLENTQWAKEKINRILFCFFSHGIFKEALYLLLIGKEQGAIILSRVQPFFIKKVDRATSVLENPDLKRNKEVS